MTLAYPDHLLGGCQAQGNVYRAIGPDTRRVTSQLSVIVSIHVSIRITLFVLLGTARYYGNLALGSKGPAFLYL